MTAIVIKQKLCQIAQNVPIDGFFRDALEKKEYKETRRIYKLACVLVGLHKNIIGILEKEATVLLKQRAEYIPEAIFCLGYVMAKKTGPSEPLRLREQHFLRKAKVLMEKINILSAGIQSATVKEQTFSNALIKCLGSFLNSQKEIKLKICFQRCVGEAQKVIDENPSLRNYLAKDLAKVAILFKVAQLSGQTIRFD